MHIRQNRSFLQSNMERRSLLKLMGAGAALGLAGTTGFPRLAAAADEELAFWASGTLDIGENWSRLASDTGLSTVFTDNGNDPGPVVAKLVAGNGNDLYDIGGLQGGAEKELAKQGAIAPWDVSRIPNYAKVWDFAKQIPYLYHEGKQYGLPSVLNADSMIYLPDRVGEIDSYGVIFDPKLKGKVGMEDAWINSAVFTAMYLKESENAPIVEPGNLTESELGLVMEFLIKHKRDGQFRTFWSGWEQGVQLVADEEVWAMTGWEPIVKAAQERGINAKYAAPKEGYEGWGNNTILMKGAVERGLGDAAHRFADWLLAGYYGCVLGKMRGYVVPTDNNVAYAEAHPDEFKAEEVKGVADHVKAKFSGKVYWQNTRPDNFQLYEEWWQKLRNA
ncbi:spermidine/putrescine ABC transporter substrate-binding protein [Mesorhizobium sp. L-8-10]|uniref:ABC transporter substrate-binding protein n=1 Tax=Mesorhizobium sp. L-8-10 TaxID=2744523 RepID=UPI0019283CCA|nr:extracellular solute-binding protein [Mesorhizobium sp. L-8-10]BCH32278.1 spermidine/putrescine ABC transporter substrate-binding protein [Mesorhizobium sp. L-8-10]